MHWCDFVCLSWGFDFVFVSLAPWICGFIKLIKIESLLFQIIFMTIPSHFSGTLIIYTLLCLILSLLSL